MPFPIAIVGIVGIVGVVGVGAAIHEDHSDYSDHSRYSDAEARRKRAEAAKEKQRLENLKYAKREMDATLTHVRNALANEAGNKGRTFFDRWNMSSSDFSYKNFVAEYNKLDSDAQGRIRQATSKVFDDEEHARQEELDKINAMLRRIAETKLTR